MKSSDKLAETKLEKKTELEIFAITCKTRSIEIKSFSLTFGNNTIHNTPFVKDLRTYGSVVSNGKTLMYYLKHVISTSETSDVEETSTSP